MTRTSIILTTRSRPIGSLILLLCGCAVARGAAPPGGSFERPPYQRLRYDEDYRYLRNPAKRADVWDPIKYMPFDEAGDWYLSLGGEARQRYEFYNNYRWDPASPEDDGYLLQRYLLHADLHLGPSLRAFGQLQSGLGDWRDGGPRGVDENRLDVHQLFVDVGLPIGPGDDPEYTLRLGRQEMMYGSQRLIAVRDTPNIRRAFDGGRLLTRLGDWRVDAFVVRPVEDDAGTFDDWGADHSDFWGVYATRPLPFVGGVAVDLYYLGLDRQDATFAQGTADEQRHTAGGRVFGARGEWDYNFETAIQWGSFGGDEIIAWTAASDTGYTFEVSPWRPRVGLRADVISGDNDPDDDRLGTFNALFPRGSYFGEIALIGPANLFDVHPTLDLHLTEALTVMADWDFFWRYSTHDGLYDNGGNVLRGADGRSRFVGHQPSIGVEWRIGRHTTVNVVYSRFFAGEFIDESGPSADVDFVGASVQYRF